MLLATRCLLPLAFLLAGGAPAFGGPGKIVDVTTVGVVGDGATLNTAPLQKAIDALAAGGGGTVRFPAGRYLMGTIEIKSNITILLDDDATLLGSTDAGDYRNLDPFTDGSGNAMGFALIVGVDAHHVAIEGGGTIDGQGKKLAATQKPYTMRPFLIRWVRCSDVTMKNVHLTHPGAWTLNLFDVNGAVIDGVTIRSREQKLRNNDGIDIDSSQHVKVRHCDIVSGDDALVIKSTGDKPSTDIAASDCKLSSHTNAIKLGTESYGGFDHISVSNCQIRGTDMAGIALYEVDGGNLQHVTVSDVTMDGVAVPISIRLGARLKTFREGDKPKKIGALRDITIKNVSAKHIKLIGVLINGIPGHPVRNITLKNIQMVVPGGGTAEEAKVELPEKKAAYPEFNMFGKVIPAYGIYARHVEGLKLVDVRMRAEKADGRPSRVLIDVH